MTRFHLRKRLKLWASKIIVRLLDGQPLADRNYTAEMLAPIDPLIVELETRARRVHSATAARERAEEKRMQEDAIVAEALRVEGKQEHLTTCYEENTGIHPGGDYFWVCSSGCPTVRMRKKLFYPEQS